MLSIFFLIGFFSKIAAVGKLPAQSLALGLGRLIAKVRVSVPLVDERNLFNFLPLPVLLCGGEA